MLRSLFTDRNLTAAPGALDVSPVLVAIRGIVLLMALVTVPLAEPHLGAGAAGPDPGPGRPPGARPF